MAMVKATEDILEPGVREGVAHLIARKGQMYDERLAPGRTPTASESHDDTERSAEDPTHEGYDGMKVAELRSLADDRGLEHDGLKKDELVELLEQDDAGV